jgi:hypothetical protein
VLGRIHNYMTSPEGETLAGWWQITAIDLRSHLRDR